MTLHSTYNRKLLQALRAEPFVTTLTFGRYIRIIYTNEIEFDFEIPAFIRGVI